MWSRSTADFRASSRTTAPIMSARAGRPIRGRFITFRIAAAPRRSGSWTPDGANARQITHLSTEATGILVSPDGKKIVFLSSVYPDCGADDACNKAQARRRSATAKSRRASILRCCIRHWNRMAEQAAPAHPGDERGRHRREGPDAGRCAMCRRSRWADPTITPFRPIRPSSPSRMNTDPDPAISTNSDIYTVPIAGGDATENHASVPGADDAPLYSPDGKYLAFRSQARAGYESDRWRLMVLERATRPHHQSHRRPGPLGGQLHLVARFDAAVSSPWKIAAAPACR